MEFKYFRCVTVRYVTLENAGNTHTNMSKINTYVIQNKHLCNTFWMSLKNLNQLYIKYILFLV